MTQILPLPVPSTTTEYDTEALRIEDDKFVPFKKEVWYGTRAARNREHREGFCPASWDSFAYRGECDQHIAMFDTVYDQVVEANARKEVRNAEAREHCTEEPDANDEKTRNTLKSYIRAAAISKSSDWSKKENNRQSGAAWSSTTTKGVPGTIRAALDPWFEEVFTEIMNATGYRSAWGETAESEWYRIDSLMAAKSQRVRRQVTPDEIRADVDAVLRAIDELTGDGTWRRTHVDRPLAARQARAQATRHAVDVSDEQAHAVAFVWPRRGPASLAEVLFDRFEAAWTGPRTIASAIREAVEAHATEHHLTAHDDPSVIELGILWSAELCRPHLVGAPQPASVRAAIALVAGEQAARGATGLEIRRVVTTLRKS